MHKDLQHLQLLAIFHYIVGGLVMLVASFFLLHFSLGVMMIVAPATMGGSGPPPPAFMGWMFALLGGGAVLVGWTIGINLMIAGRFLNRHTHYIYCLVMAGVAMLFAPLGVVLGVFTIVVLVRPSVKHLFDTGELPYDPEEDDEIDSNFNNRIRTSSYNIHGER